MTAWLSEFSAYLSSDQRVKDALFSNTLALFVNIWAFSRSLSTEFGPLSYNYDTACTYSQHMHVF
jgi:hypothetical protein